MWEVSSIARSGERKMTRGWGHFGAWAYRARVVPFRRGKRPEVMEEEREEREADIAGIRRLREVRRAGGSEEVEAVSWWRRILRGLLRRG